MSSPTVAEDRTQATPTGLARLVRPPLQIIGAHLPAYLVVNALMYGLFLVGVATALAFPGLKAGRVSALDADGTTDLVVSLLDNVWLFALVIFGVNTVTAGLASIVLPSLVVPFAGIAVFAVRAVIFGLTLAPTDRVAAISLVPHSVTILLEFQAYVLLMLGAYLLGRAWLRPRLEGAPNRRQGYLRGLRQLGWLSLPALALFVVGAIHEAFSLRYLVPLLVLGWT